MKPNSVESVKILQQLFNKFFEKQLAIDKLDEFVKAGACGIASEINILNPGCPQDSRCLIKGEA